MHPKMAIKEKEKGQHGNKIQRSSNLGITILMLSQDREMLWEGVGVDLVKSAKLAS